MASRSHRARRRRRRARRQREHRFARTKAEVIMSIALRQQLRAAVALARMDAGMSKPGDGKLLFGLLRKGTR